MGKIVASNEEMIDSKNKGKNKKKFSTKKVAPYMFLLPIIIIFAIFTLYPVINSFILSFYEFKGGEYFFVGLDNYMRLLEDTTFAKSLLNTLIYTIVQVPTMILLSLVLGSILNSAFLKFKGFFRLSFFLPVVVSMVAYSVMFKLLLNTDYGIVNILLESIGIDKVAWLDGEFTSKLAIILGVTWRWTGYNTVIVLAGLQGISEEVYEAARIDGANAVQRFFKITVPLLKPIILFIAITSTIGTLQLFDESFIITGGGPNNATISISHLLFNTAFRSFDFGYASAMSYVLVILMGILSFIQFKINKEK